MIKNISGFETLVFCNFRDVIYAQSACNTPKRKLKSHHMTPLHVYFRSSLSTSLKGASYGNHFVLP